MKYTYDESGVTFYYFLLSVLSIILIPWTILIFFKPKNENKFLTKKKYVRKEKKSPINWKLILISLGWISVAMLSYKVINTKIEMKTWDPYEILGLDPETPVDQVKKTYKKLSLKWHPDKVAEDEKEAAEKQFVEITKAYKVLTDEEARLNFEQYGHPDGQQGMTMGVALPAWLVEAHNSFWVLSVYGLLFGIMLPLYVGKWWYKSLQYTKDQILHSTMAHYFKDLKENTSMYNLIEILAASDEFRFESTISSKDSRLQKVTSELKSVMDKVTFEKFQSTPKNFHPMSQKSLTLLYAHFFRVEISDAELLEEQQKIVEKSLHLVNGMLQITFSQGWLSLSMTIMHLSQMLVQAVFYQQSGLLQLPYIDQSTAEKFSLKPFNVRSIRQFLKMDESQRNDLASSLSPHELNQAIATAKNNPRVQIKKAHLRVIGDEHITPSSIISFIVTLKKVTEAEFDPDSKPEASEDVEIDEQTGDVTPKKKRKSEERPAPITAPYCPIDKRPYFWVILGESKSNRFMLPPIKVADLIDERTLTIQFQAPPNPGTYSFSMWVVSDSIIGIDQSRDVKMVISSPSVLPEEPEIDDDISEPEDNSLSAQLAQAQSTTSQGKKVLADHESSDEEE